MHVLLASMIVSAAAATSPMAAGVSSAMACSADRAAAAIEPLMTRYGIGQDDETDAAFEPLRRQLQTLFSRYSRGAQLNAQDRRSIEAILEEVRTFAEAHEGYVPALAAELELLNILTRTDSLTQDMHDRIDRAQDVLVRLLDAVPANPALRLMYARNDLLLNRYGAAQATLEGFAFNYAEQPVAALLLARCYFADHRFDEALDVLDQIPIEGLGNPTITARVDQRRTAIRDAQEHWEREAALREAEASADDLPRIEIETSRGRIVVELFEDHAPNHVANIISLAEQGYYDNTRFHRVISNFMAQGGDPNTRPAADDAAESSGQPGSGGPGYAIADEHTRDDARMHFTGSLSMAKTSAPHTGGSQFFLCHEPATHLNGRHTVFGRVLEGQDVVWALRIDDVLESMTVQRKRDHPYVVEPYDPEAEQDSAGDDSTESATEEGDSDADDGEEGSAEDGTDAGGSGDAAGASR